VTTIIGLPFRQLLFAYAPGQIDQDNFFRILEDELRRSATQFSKSQAEFVILIQDFIATREILFTQEETASKKYIANLEKASKVFDEALDGIPSQISSALTSCATNVNELKIKLHDLAKASQAVDGDSFALTIKQVDAVKSLATEMSTTLTSVITSITSIGGAAKDADLGLRTIVEGMQRDLKGVDAVLSEFIEVTRERISRLQ
jgi:hypothetical protein